jgi:hypothetical protein
METRSFDHKVHQTFNSDGGILSLFEPDPVVFAQYFDSLRRKTLLEPEKMLMLAVLEDAIKCFQNKVLARSRRRENFSRNQKRGSLRGIAIGFFPLRISVRS